MLSAKDYTIDSINGVCLCRCNNCGAILIDENPQLNATKYLLKGNEKNMEYFFETVDSLICGCPNCATDSYLIDLQNTI